VGAKVAKTGINCRTRVHEQVATLTAENQALRAQVAQLQAQLRA
jgi:cell division protein FtsB